MEIAGFKLSQFFAGQPIVQLTYLQIFRIMEIAGFKLSQFTQYFLFRTILSTQPASKKPTKTICRTNRLLAPPPLSSFGLWADFGFRSFETPIKGVLNTLFLGLTLFKDYSD